MSIPERVFPIMLTGDYLAEANVLRSMGHIVMLIAVPWPLVQEHHAQAIANHKGQSLEGIARRGGLSIQELAAVLADNPTLPPTVAIAIRIVRTMLDNWVDRKRNADKIMVAEAG